MPYGQSPWEDAASGAQGMGSGMARIMQAQQVGRMRAQQFAAQLAIRQQQEQIQQQRLQMDQQETGARIPLLKAQTGEADSVTAKNKQEVGRQGEMDDLARAVANNVFRQRVPGGEAAALRGDFTGTPGPTIANDQVLNQGDLVRNAMQLIAMHNPNELSTMMMGKNIPRGDVNFNPLTQEQVQGNPPAAPTGAPIDPASGMTAYQTLALQLQKSRMADQEKRTQAIFDKLHTSPEWQMEHGDETDTGDSSNSNKGKKPSRAQASEYVKKYGSPQAATKQLQTEGFDTSGYAD